MNRKALLAVLLLAFVGYAGWSFVNSLNPYVGITAAKKTSGSVQVKGLLDDRGRIPHMEGNTFVFFLRDEETNETMMVRYKGVKPDQFDQAHHIVAVGKYHAGAFHAEKLLIKCPSKYEKQKGK